MTKKRVGRYLVGGLLGAAVVIEIIGLADQGSCGARVWWAVQRWWVPVTPALVVAALIAALILRARTQWFLLLVAIVPLYIADLGAVVNTCVGG